MTLVDTVQRGREAYDRRAWSEAFSTLSTADAQGTLAAPDLERLGMVAHFLGRDTESDELLARAFRAHLTHGDLPGAARCAFWMGFGLLNRGDAAQGSGWLSRARSTLDEYPEDCVERGYLLIPLALQSQAQGDHASAHATLLEVSRIAERFDDGDLITLARLGRGDALVRLGQTAEGIALLDEAMVAVTADEVSPVVAGIVYCAVIEACSLVFDLRRAQEWTEALSRWCESQPDLVPYRGECLVRRAEIMQLHGAWPDALREAKHACERLSGKPAVGTAFYVTAELHRARGEFAAAEDAYREASRWGRSPQPGFALLRLALGDGEAAAGAIRRVLDETSTPMARPPLLAAAVEIMLAAGSLDAARASADELVRGAQDLDVPLMHAIAGHAEGAVLLAEGEPRRALTALRRALSAWHALEVPYEAARTRVLIGLACRALGDEDGALFEFDAARRTFEALDAAPALSQLDSLSREERAPAGGLTPRELEVLRLVAAGKTNRAIAGELVISEKTVARHVSNIFAKLEVSSRSAATAYAYEHALL